MDARNAPRPEEPIDEAGLTDGDRAALAEMAASSLEPLQIENMRRAFIFTERGIHKIPLVWERGCAIPKNADTLIAKAMGQDGSTFGRVGVSLKGAGRAKLSRRFPSDDREFCAVMFDSTPFSKSGMGYR